MRELTVFEKSAQEVSTELNLDVTTAVTLSINLTVPNVDKILPCMRGNAERQLGRTDLTLVTIIDGEMLRCTYLAPKE